MPWILVIDAQEWNYLTITVKHDIMNKKWPIAVCYLLLFSLFAACSACVDVCFMNVCRK